MVLFAHDSGHFMARSRYERRVDEEGYDAGLVEYGPSEKTDTGRAYTTPASM